MTIFKKPVHLVHVGKIDPIKKGLSTERFSPQISQEHKWYMFHMGDWVYFLLFLSPFSYGYKFSQPDRWVMCLTVEPMTNKSCCVMWCPKLFCKQASRYPPKCLAVGGPPNLTELLFSKFFPGALRTLSQGESDGRLQSHGGSLNTGLWPLGLSTRGSDPIYLNHSHSPCEVNLEGVLKKRQMIITMATGCTINVGSFCQTNSCLSPFTFSLIVA